MKKVYLDNAATTRTLPEVFKAMLPYLKGAYGNPQSIHDWGDEAREAVEKARRKVAALIGAEPEEIIFTGNGSESNNLAIKGLALARQEKGKHVVVSAVEHLSVQYAARTLGKLGFEVTHIPVDKYGLIDPGEVARSIRSGTILVSIMHANGEVGTIQPIREIAKLVEKRGIAFHTDAVATTGIIPVDAPALGVDALSMAANAFYGPKGVGAMYLCRGTRIMPLLDGGVQEGGRRAGTDNVPGIVGMGKAAELAAQHMGSRTEATIALRDKLIKGLLSDIPNSILTGHPEKRLPGNASFCIEFIEGEAMLMFLNDEGIAASSGSTCTSRALKASHVLTAMGIPPEVAQGSLLFSLGVDNSEEDVYYVLDMLPPIVERLRRMSPLYAKFLKTHQGGK